MARKANPDQMRTTIDLSPDCKALLIRLCESEDKPMGKTICDALAIYDAWLKEQKKHAASDLVRFLPKKGRK